MSSDPFKDMFPEHMRRTLAEQARQIAEMQRTLGPTIQAAQEALSALGGSGLDRRTLDAIQSFAAPPFQESMSQVVAAASRVNEVLRHSRVIGDIGAAFARSLEVPAFLRDLKLPTVKELKAGQRRFVRAAESLAKAGWTFSREMAPAEVLDLVKRDGALDPVALDEWFVRHYAADGGRERRRLASRLLRKKRLQAWRPLLLEALWAYRHRRYRLVIASLLPVIEGLVCEASGTVREKSTNPSRQWRERVAKPAEDFLVEAEWCVVIAFLGNLWGRHDFDGPAPFGLKRHWVEHGRRPDVGGHADALRLLAGVDFIAQAAEDIEGLAKALRRKRRK